MPFWGMSATVALPSTWLRNCGCCEAACAPTTRIATAALASRPPSSHPLQHSRAPCCAPPAPQVHDALKNRPRALHWYRAALEADPLCIEALEAILGGHFLSGAQERALVDSLARSGRIHQLAAAPNPPLAARASGCLRPSRLMRWLFQPGC